MALLIFLRLEIGTAWMRGRRRRRKRKKTKKKKEEEEISDQDQSQSDVNAPLRLHRPSHCLNIEKDK